MGELAGGKTMLEHLYERLQGATRLDELVVSTSTNPIDDRLASIVERRGWPLYRGSENDVLDRMYQAAVQFGAEVVVRISGDCILHDPKIVDLVVDRFFDVPDLGSFVCNKRPFTWPDGFDVEVCTMSMFQEIWESAKTTFEREHVFPYVYADPDRFRMINVERDGPELFHTYRVVLDYPEDLALIRAIIEAVGPSAPFPEILTYLERHPDVVAPTNRHLPPPDLFNAWQFEIDRARSQAPA